MTWHEDAQCQGLPIEAFAPEGLTPKERAVEAERLCRGCPVWRECAESAIEEGAVCIIRSGIYLPISIKVARAMLEQVLASETQPNQYEVRRKLANGNHSAPKGICSQCGATLRHTTMLKADYPDTVLAANANTCRGCDALSKPTSPCSVCKRQMRPPFGRAADFPETTSPPADKNKSVCRPCFTRLSKEKDV